MANLPLFETANLTRDRALGMAWGAACGARAALPLGPTWPSADDMLIHLSESLIQYRILVPADLQRLLIQAWCGRVGKPVLVAGATRGSRSTQGSFVAGVVPICIGHRNDRMAAQRDVAELARTFGADETEGEALEVMAWFLRRALFGEPRDRGLAAFEWHGDARVAEVARGRSLPIDAGKDLVGAVEQARSVALANVSIGAAFAALAAVEAPASAFVLGGALIGALDGTQAFQIDQTADRGDTLSAKLEALVEGLLALPSERVTSGRFGAGA